MARAWAIKLGSGGQCIEFCESRKIVGVGWRDVDEEFVSQGSRSRLAEHVRKVCKWYKTDRERGTAVGQLYRFGRECRVGDYILYYDPPKKHVVIGRVTSDAMKRDFDLADPTDIWHYRRVDYPIAPIPLPDFYGALKGRLLGPRMSFWELHPADAVDQLAKGNSPSAFAATDPEIETTFRRLRELVVRRAEALDAADWEWLVVDYFKAQGAHVDERSVGGSTAIIDAEARFGHGELGEEVWRVQVKRFQDKKVDWPTIAKDFSRIGDARFCFVSVYGFTEEARTRAEAEGVRLMEAGDFTRFLLSGRIRPRLREKLRLPLFADLGRENGADGSESGLSENAEPRVEDTPLEEPGRLIRLLREHPVNELSESTKVTHFTWKLGRAVLGRRLLRTYQLPDEGEVHAIGFVLRSRATDDEERNLLDAIRAPAPGSAVELRGRDSVPAELDIDDEENHAIELTLRPVSRAE